MSKNPRKKRADQYDETDSLTYVKNTDEYPRGDSIDNKKKVYPFNKYQFQEDEQGGLINSDRKDQSFYDLAKDMGFQKTADNDIFDKYQMQNKNYWLDVTFFKRAYQHVGRGDVVVAFGKSLNDSQIIRRRFVSVDVAGKEILKTLYPLIKNAISQPQTPTDSDSLAEQQGYNPAASNPYLRRRDELREKETDGGMDVDKPSERVVRRSPILYEDEESTNQIYASKHPIKSILEQITPQVWAAKTVEEANSVIIPLLEQSGIDDDDKQKMIAGFQSMPNIRKLQQYFANALLKYEGMGTKLSKIAKIVWNPKSLTDVKEELKSLVSDKDRLTVEGAKSIEDLQVLVVNSIRRFKTAEDEKAKLDEQYESGQISLDDYLHKITELGFETPTSETPEQEEPKTPKEKSERQKQLEHALSDKPMARKDYNMGVYMALSPIYSIIANPKVFEALAAQGKDATELKHLVETQIQNSTILDDGAKDRFYVTLNKFDFTTRKGVLNFLKFLSNALLKAQRLGVYPRTPHVNTEIEVSEKPTEKNEKDHVYTTKEPPVENLFEYNVPAEEEKSDDTIVTSSDIHVKVYGNINDVTDVHLGVDELGLHNCHGGYTPGDGYFITTSLGYKPFTVKDVKVILDKIKSGASTYFHNGRLGVFSAEIKLKDIPEEQLNKEIEEGSQRISDPGERGFKSLFDEAMGQIDNPQEAEVDLIALYYGILSRGESAPSSYQQALPQIEEALTLAKEPEAINQFQTKMQEIYNTLTKTYGPSKTPVTPIPTPTKTPPVETKPTEKPKRYQPPISPAEQKQEDDFKAFQEEQERREREKAGLEPRGEKQEVQRKTFEENLAKQKQVDMMSAMIETGKLPKEVIEPLEQQFSWIGSLVNPNQLVSTEEFTKTYKPTAPEIKKQPPTPKTPTGKGPIEMTPEKAKMLEKTMKGELPKPQTLKKITPEQVKDMQERMKGKNIPTPTGVPPKKRHSSLNLKKTAENVIIDPSTGQPFETPPAEVREPLDLDQEQKIDIRGVNTPENPQQLLQSAQQEAKARFQSLHDKYHALYPNANEDQLRMHINAQMFKELINKHISVSVVRQILGLPTSTQQQQESGTSQIAQGLGQMYQGAFEEAKSIAKNLSLKKKANLSWNDLSPDEQVIAKNFADQVEKEFNHDATKLSQVLAHPMFPFALESRIEKTGFPKDVAEILSYAVHDIILLDIEAFSHSEKFKQANLSLKSQMTTHQTIENSHADINKEIPLERVEDEPVVKEEIVEITVTKTSAVDQRRIDQVTRYLMSMIEEVLQSEGRAAEDPEHVMPIIENKIIDSLKVSKDKLLAWGLSINNIADALDKVAQIILDKSNTSLILDVNSIIHTIESMFPEPTRKTEKPMPLSLEEQRFVELHTSDDIWNIARDSSTEGTPDGIMARDLIQRGLIASNTKIEKKAAEDDIEISDVSETHSEPDTPTGTKLSEYSGPADGPFKCSNCIHYNHERNSCKHSVVITDPEMTPTRLSETTPVEGVTEVRVEPDGCCKFVRHAFNLNLKKTADYDMMGDEEAQYIILRNKLAREMFGHDFWMLLPDEKDEVSSAAYEEMNPPENSSSEELFG